MVDLRGPCRRRAGGALPLGAELFIFRGAGGTSILVMLAALRKDRYEARRSRPGVRIAALGRAKKESAPASAGADSFTMPHVQEQDFFAQLTVFDVAFDPPSPVAVSVTV